MPYTVVLTRQARKEFLDLPPTVQRRIQPKIDALAHDPRPSGCKKLTGSDTLYRIRVGSYRIIYEISDRELIVTIVRIRSRGSAYG